MIHLRPQRVYKPSALSYLGNTSDIADSIIDRYLNKDLYRPRIETPRGTSITADNSQITCYAHIFDKDDGTELTDLLKGRGYRPTWLLDGKPIDSTRISEEGYKLTLETNHLPAIYQAVTLQVRDTDILLALTTDEIQKRIYSQLIELGSIPTHLIKTSEKLLNVSRLDQLRFDDLKLLQQELSKGISANTTALSELHKHPLTISEEGYWRIWDITRHQYVTTEYQSRGEKGEPGDKGDKGDKPKLTLDSQLRLLADGELLSQQSLKGDKGDRGETGARGATGATGAKGDKGDKPKLTLDSQLRLLADGELLSQQSLKGRDGKDGAKGADGKDGAKGADGKDGHTPVIKWSGTKLVIDDKAPVDLQGQRGEAGHSPSPDEVLRTDSFRKQLTSEVTTQVAPVSNDIEDVKTTVYNNNRYAVDLINNTQNQLCTLQVLGMSDSGVIEVKRHASCPVYGYQPPRVYTPDSTPKPTYEIAQIPLTLRSTHNALKRQVDSLSARLAKLEITPVTNCDLRKRGSTLYPQYSDWLLTSDTSDLYISFSGLRAEIGRSIYIQTRRKAYFFANGHSFYGLPGSSTSVNQWLSNNTTYRFVRCSSDSWFVTSSPSPYPWT